MKLTLITISLIVFALHVDAQNEKFQINGSARSYLFANQLNISNDVDSITAKKSNYGHNLLDLGISAFPNKQTEVIGIFRIRNELGGFWGGGVNFDVRQLTLKGVAANVVRYEIGDIDLKMTPYTLFNHSEEGFLNESGLFSLRRNIVHYDLFYNNNQWRMQGAKVGFNLLPSNHIDKIEFKGHLTRQRPTGESGDPERLYGGGSINFVKNKNIAFAFNSVHLFDLTQTSATDSSFLWNNVSSANFHWQMYNNNFATMKIEGESGFSNSHFKNFSDLTTPLNSDEWFYDISSSINLNSQSIKFNVGFKDVGKDFSAPGAQTKRVNFDKSPVPYQQFTNNYIGRTVTTTDIINGNTSNSRKISESLMAYNVVYNNSNPYGNATPNRKGAYLKCHNLDSGTVKNSYIEIYALQESAGSGTTRKKSFLLTKLGTDIAINEWIKHKQALLLNFGFRNEITLRGGQDFEQINLTSNFIDVGLSYEFVKNLNILFGGKLWNAQGNEQKEVRNSYNEIIDFEPLTINFTEQILACGLQYDFGQGNALSLQYQNFTITDNVDQNVNYGISEFIILFSLMF